MAAERHADAAAPLDAWFRAASRAEWHNLDDSRAACGQTELTPEEQALMELLTVLIERFEEAHYALPLSSPADVILHLMDANGPKQKDLGRCSEPRALFPKC